MTLKSTATPSQSGPRGNDIEEILNIHQSSRNEASPSDSFESYQDTRWEGGLTSLQSYSRRILQPQPIGLWRVEVKVGEQTLAEINIHSQKNQLNYSMYMDDIKISA